MPTLDSLDIILSFSGLRRGYEQKLLLVSRLFNDLGVRYAKRYSKKIEYYRTNFIDEDKAKRVIKKYNNIKVCIERHVERQRSPPRHLSKIILDRTSVVRSIFSDYYIVSDETVYYKNGKLHREDGPAYRSMYRNGNVKTELYYVEGKHHREEDLPSQTEYRYDGSKDYVVYYKHDKKHRENGPAVIRYFDTNEVREEEWYYDDLLHCTIWNYPAVTRYFYDGNKSYEAYYVRGFLMYERIYEYDDVQYAVLD